MAHPIKILMVLTSHASIGDTGHLTGVWFEELTSPYYAFIDAGIEVDIASINGGKVPIDPGSLKPAGENPVSIDRFLKDATAMSKIAASQKVDGLSVNDMRPCFYRAVTAPCGICRTALRSANCCRMHG